MWLWDQRLLLQGQEQNQQEQGPGSFWEGATVRPWELDPAFSDLTLIHFLGHCDGVLKSEKP